MAEMPKEPHLVADIFIFKRLSGGFVWKVRAVDSRPFCMGSPRDGKQATRWRRNARTVSVFRVGLPSFLVHYPIRGRQWHPVFAFDDVIVGVAQMGARSLKPLHITIHKQKSVRKITLEAISPSLSRSQLAI